MLWRKFLLPLLCVVMCFLNLRQFSADMDPKMLFSQGLVTLFWLALAVLCFRGLSGKKDEKKDEDK